MPSTPDHSLRIADQLAPHTWELEPQPVSLFLLWPDDQLTQSRVLEMLAASAGESPTEITPLDENSEVLWACVCEFSRLNQPILLWCERAKPVHAQELADPSAADCKWVVGVQTALDFDDPIADFAQLIHLLAKAFPNSPAMFDADVGLWHTRTALNRFADHAFAVPANELLWTIHVVSGKAPASSTASTSTPTHSWIHTHGLARCGLPDLELLQVPADLVAVGAEFLNLLVELVMELGLPEPGEIASIGEGLDVTFVPVHSAIQSLPTGEPGGGNDRADEAHAGIRAAVCSSVSTSDSTICPIEVLRKIRDGSTAILLGDRATVRRTRLARHHWDDFANALNEHAQHRLRNGTDSAVEFLVKVGCAISKDQNGEPNREHLWFRAIELADRKVRAELLVQPLQIRRMNKGDTLWLNLDDMSDWRIATLRKTFSPGHIIALESITAHNQ